MSEFSSEHNAESTGATEQVYGHLLVAGMEVALPLAAMREALPCPRVLDGLPTDAPGLLGAINHRSAVLPVMDLAPATGRPASRHEGDVVVVVASGDRLVGVLTEEVRGIVKVPTAALMDTRAAGTDLMFTSTFTHPQTGTVVAVLEPSALVALPGIPTVRAAPPSAGVIAGVTGDLTGAAGNLTGTVPGQVATSGATRHLMLVRCGDQAIAVDVAHVHTTTPQCSPRPSVLSSDLCRGVVDFRDLEVPVIDPLVLFGLGSIPPGPIEAGLVLSSAHGYVILAVNALLDLRVIPADDVLPMSGFSLHRPELVAGILTADAAGQCIVADGEALLRAPEVLALSSVNTVSSPEADATPTAAVPRGDAAGAASVASGQATGGAARAGDLGAHLIFTAGVDVTTALDQVVEILPHPADLTQTSMGGSLLGVLVHRGHAVPILELTSLLGRTPGELTSSSCVLVVDVDGEHVGFAVESLAQVSTLMWSDPDTPEGGRPVQLHRLLPSAELVQVTGDDKLLPKLDLRAIARAVRDPAGASRGSLTPA